MVGVQLIGPRDDFEQFLFHLENVFSRCQTGSVANSEDMGVDGHGRLMKSGVEHHIGRLSSHPRQSLQGIPCIRHLTAVAIDQEAAGFDDVLGLAVVETDGFNVGRQSFDAEREDGLRGIGDRVQAGGGFVDADIRGLGRKDNGDQQFERAAVMEFGLRIRVAFLKTPEDFGPFDAIHLIVPVTRIRSLGASLSWRVPGFSALLASMQFFRAIKAPNTRNAPGGRMASRNPE